MKYTATGEYTKSGTTDKFTKTVDAKDEKMAKEKIYAELGSKQGIIRKNITIGELKVKK